MPSTITSCSYNNNPLRADQIETLQEEGTYSIAKVVEKIVRQHFRIKTPGEISYTLKIEGRSAQLTVGDQTKTITLSDQIWKLDNTPINHQKIEKHFNKTLERIRNASQTALPNSISLSKEQTATLPIATNDQSSLVTNQKPSTSSNENAITTPTLEITPPPISKYLAKHILLIYANPKTLNYQNPLFYFYESKILRGPYLVPINLKSLPFSQKSIKSKKETVSLKAPKGATLPIALRNQTFWHQFSTSVTNFKEQDMFENLSLSKISLASLPPESGAIDDSLQESNPYRPPVTQFHKSNILHGLWLTQAPKWEYNDLNNRKTIMNTLQRHIFGPEPLPLSASHQTASFFK